MSRFPYLKFHFYNCDSFIIYMDDLSNKLGFQFLDQLASEIFLHPFKLAVVSSQEQLRAGHNKGCKCDAGRGAE